MKKTLFCFICILFGTQANAVNFRTSSDDAPRIRGGDSAEVVEKQPDQVMCKVFSNMAVTTKNQGRNQNLIIVGQCDDGTLWEQNGNPGWKILSQDSKDQDEQ